MNETMEMTDKQSDSSKKIFTIPNLLSFFRICLIPIMVWLYCAEQEYMWTGVVLLISGATDLVDGFIARTFHAVSDLGKILDPVADKLTQMIMLICLLSRFPLMWIPVILMFFKELFMGITGLMVIKTTGQVFGAQWHGKVATFLLYFTMAFHIFWHNIPSSISVVLIGVCTVMMVISLILYGAANIGAIKQAKENKEVL